MNWNNVFLVTFVEMGVNNWCVFAHEGMDDNTSIGHFKTEHEAMIEATHHGKPVMRGFENSIPVHRFIERESTRSEYISLALEFLQTLHLGTQKQRRYDYLRELHLGE